MSERKIEKCPVCSGKPGKLVCRELYFGNEYHVSRCSQCAVLFTSFQQRDMNTDGMEKTSRETFEKKYGEILKGLKNHDRHENYLEEVATIQKFANSGDYLDVGCHAGWLLSYLKKYTQFNLMGIEPSPTTAKLTAERLGVKVVNSYVKDGVLADESFDFVSMTDVFEHLPNPGEVLGVLRKALRPKGKIMIKVPNGSFTHLKYRLKNLLPFLIFAKDTFDAKEHLVHYHQAALRKILESNGFKIVLEKVPKPVQTRGSRKSTRLARSAFYRLGRAGLLPPQDLLVVAEKQSASPTFS